MSLDVNFNPWIILYIVMVGIAFFFFNEFGLPVASTYITLLLISIVFLVVSMLIFRESEVLGDLMPFNRSFLRGTAAYVLGGVVVIALFSVGGFLTFLNVTDGNFYNPLVSAPLASSPSGDPTVFSALVLKANPFVQWFVITKGASIFEEFVNFVMVFVGAGLTVLIIAVFMALANRKSPIGFVSSAASNRNVVFVGAMVFSVLFFAGIHFLNDTYVDNPRLFAFAAGFRLVVNLLIYKFVMWGWSFGLGTHEFNNNLAYAVEFGFDALMQAVLNSLGLLVVVATWVVPLLIVIFKWSEIRPMIFGGDLSG